ncbi:hypothetical protein EI77_04698 [Prosthecobacter fusiformis]|uniref:Uncharacterized protein n=2 Tax=Prosthecobacter fusiformis TaxID=48464 RepID=A0A4R7RI62_9BACT|nr:hypothetical protein EI77_04698 [Prosthecobacter fusiformis]
MSAAEQANAWWAELTAMLEAAVREVNYQAGNEKTMVMSGLTTVVGVRE